MAIKHAFTSAKADGGDATLIRPSDWNADHDGSAEDVTVAAPLTGNVQTVLEGLADPASLPRASYSGNAVDIPDANVSAAPLTWDSLGSGVALLDLTDPEVPEVIEGGIYAVTASVQVTSSVPGDEFLTAGGMFLVVLHLDFGDVDSICEMTGGNQQPGGAEPMAAIVSLNNTYYIPANGTIAVTVNNRDGAESREFRLREAMIQMIARG